MSKNDKDAEPLPSDSEEYYEPEDWDLPSVITEEEEEEECPEILEIIEPEEAIGTLFENIHISTIVTFLLGIFTAIFFYLAKTVFSHIFPGWSQVLLGFLAGLLIVFGASEIIILAVKGIKDKLNWNPYLGGILSAIGAALAELVVVTVLLIRSEVDNNPDLAITSITLILTTVIINIFFLGLSIIFVSRKEPFELPKELTLFESNLVLGMMVFTFVMLLYGFYYKFTAEGLIETSFSRGVEIVIGVALLLVYGIFIIILVKRLGKKTSTPQTLITEFFPDEDEVIIKEPSTDVIEMRLVKTRAARTVIAHNPRPAPEPCEVESKSHTKNGYDRHTALATLRRFPWIIIVLLIIVGAGGVIWGGELLASAIEKGLYVLEEDYKLTVPILVYAVVVGTISSAPELIVTFRGLLNPDKEIRQVGLVNQVSAINQTFFILFGFPFLLSGIIGIGIPVSINITIVMGGIFIMAAAEVLMIIDDNKFDILEGVVITILASVSLLALALMGGE